MQRSDRDVIVTQWRELRDYARKMVEPLRDDQMIAQPIAGVTLNHPAWILSHLAAYGPMLASILREQPVEDPADHPHGMKSAPLGDPGAYLARLQLLDHFTSSYDDAAEAFLEAPDALLARATPFARWSTRFPTIAHLPPQFFLKHTATHLGQLSVWRRAMGLGRV